MTRQNVGEPNRFQRTCMERVARTLATHGFSLARFDLDRGAKSVYWTAFDFRGMQHRVQIPDDMVIMDAELGKHLYEPYMPEEFATDEALVEGFARRLDRYLSGGDWAGPDEKSLPDLLKEKLSWLFKRTRAPDRGDRSGTG